MDRPSRERQAALKAAVAATGQKVAAAAQQHATAAASTLAGILGKPAAQLAGPLEAKAKAFARSLAGPDLKSHADDLRAELESREGGKVARPELIAAISSEHGLTRSHLESAFNDTLGDWAESKFGKHKEVVVGALEKEFLGTARTAEEREASSWIPTPWLPEDQRSPKPRQELLDGLNRPLKFAESGQTPTPAGQAPDEVAVPGHDGDQAERLLARAKAEGAACLADVTAAALRRLLREGGIEAVRKAKRLYNDGEQQDVANALAATRATAELLGRAGIRKRLEKHRGE